MTEIVMKDGARIVTNTPMDFFREAIENHANWFNVNIEASNRNKPCLISVDSVLRIIGDQEDKDEDSE